MSYPVDSIVAMTSDQEISLLRMVAQRIAGPGADSPAAAVGWLAAVQAQDLPGALTSVALRTTDGTRPAVVAALDAGQVVRSWPMRGTLHLTLAEDLPWLLRLLTGRVIAGAARRRAQLGLDEAAFARARALTEAALAGGGRLPRDELFTRWRAGGLDTTGQRGYHLLWHLAQTGLVCLGPVHGRDQAVVLVQEWIPRPRQLEREEALGELALRYFRGHGPATVKDFIRWANLTAADARTGVALARPRLTTLVRDGVEHLLDPHTPELLAQFREQAREVFLLPGFDELVLGYADRSVTLAPEFATRVVPGGNGVFQPTVVADGRIVGTWRRAGRGERQTVTAAPFTGFPPGVAEAIPERFAALP